MLVSRRHRRGRNIGIGDVVNFYHPIKVGEGGIKRVIGMPGDFVLRDTPGKGDGLLLKVSRQTYQMRNGNIASNLYW